MPDLPYLLRLGERLQAGLRGMEPERRLRHRAFVLSLQTPDGGFRGREGDSDLYYTAFAARSLAMLGGLTDQECDSLGRFVGSDNPSSLIPNPSSDLTQAGSNSLTCNVIDLVSWLYTGLLVQLSGGPDPLAGAPADWPDRIAAQLESVRTKDGGYAKTTEGARGSTYHSFLVTLVYELIGRAVPQSERLVQFLYDRQRDDGGFVEIEPMRRSGTNPTAAAVALLNMLGAMDEEVREDVRAFLKDVRSDEGGFCANTRIPFADGLSTFTGLLTCQDLGLDDVIDERRVGSYVTQQLEFPTGGFRGATWDEAADVEYTFYGLGILGLLTLWPVS